MQRDVDVVVVGSGATGGWAAKIASEAGLSVVVLEAGRDLDPARDLRREVWAATSREGTAESEFPRQLVQRQHGAFTRHSHHLFADDLDYPYETASGPFHWIRSRAVGGCTALWGGVTWRMSDHELRPETEGGWPFAYAELEPYYAEVESYHEVCGNHDRVPQLPGGDYAFAPGPLTAGELELGRILSQRWPDRRLIALRGLRSRLDPDRSDPDRWPAFASRGSTLADALATGRCELSSHTAATEILVDPSEPNRARGVVCRDLRSAREYSIRARAVVVAASTIESVRLLMMSRSPAHPDGIGASSGVLGRYLMDHWNVFILGTTPSPVSGAEFTMGGPNGAFIPRFVNLGDSPAESFLHGYGVHVAVQRPITVPGLEWPPGGRFVFLAIGETLPSADNRIELSTEQRDLTGSPVPRLHYQYGANELAMAAHAHACLREIADAAGYRIIAERAEPSVPGMAIHVVGGARMGNDPAQAVLDPWHRVWDVPNVLVVDGASWPTGGYQNNTLTLMATTVRATRRLVADLVA